MKPERSCMDPTETGLIMLHHSHGCERHEPRSGSNVWSRGRGYCAQSLAGVPGFVILSFCIWDLGSKVLGIRANMYYQNSKDVEGC